MLPAKSSAGSISHTADADIIPGCSAMMKTALIVFAAATLTVGCSSSTKPESAAAPEKKGVGSIARLDPALDALVPRDAYIVKLAGGFQFTEGPLWRPEGPHLWFSDVTGNVLREWSPDGSVRVILPHAGTDRDDFPPGSFIGPNGEIADKDGTVLLCQHANRRIVRIGKDLKLSTLVDRFEGKRFNSPNDLVYKSDGSLYFTDPPYGLPKFFDDPRKETPYSGVYQWRDGKVHLLMTDLTGPNGLAFSPDEKYFYVGNWDEKKKI